MTASHPVTAPPPFPEGRALLLAQLTDGLEAHSLWWLSGYAAALAGSAGVSRQILAPAAIAANAQLLTIVYGSQTGNSKRIAVALAEQAEAAGLGVRLLRADAYPLRELAQERHLHVVISTQGDGDPPDDARGFVEFLLGKRAPRLPELKFAILGLGDSSYPKFCEVARQLDARLGELGATRWSARGEADLDVDTVATPWTAQALALARETLRPAPPSATVVTLRPGAARIDLPLAPLARLASRDHPFIAQVLVNQRLTSRGSARDVRHIELSLDDSGLAYEPGDALGVWPVNATELVEEFAQLLGLDLDSELAHAGQTRALRAWLAEHCELTRLTRAFVTSHAALASDDTLRRLLAPENAVDFAALLGSKQPIDLLRQHPAPWSANTLLAALRPLAPRLYSIASSQALVGNEAHLTVAHLAFETDGHPRWGAASHFLAGQPEGGAVRVFIERNERFRLPVDDRRDVIMIGPGTGVAPFRGFLQERVARGASGRNWLLFGNRHLRQDFLYQLEWQAALQRGELQRMDVAFSRDGGGRTYVQHRLLEQGRAVHDWLQDGAHLYVCGDATRMARDVEATLLEILKTHGGLDDDGAADHLDALRRQGRYSRDVY